MVVWLFRLLAISIPIHSNADDFNEDCRNLNMDVDDCEAIQAFKSTIPDNGDPNNCIRKNWDNVKVDDSGRVFLIELGEYCNLKGSLVPELGNLTSLTKLVLYGNDLRGSNIPSELDNLENLETLYLSSCNLTGPIPNELGKLKQLDSLLLASNHLNGSVPQELVNNLSGIRAVNMTHNDGDGGRTGSSCTATPCHYGVPVP